MRVAVSMRWSIMICPNPVRATERPPISPSRPTMTRCLPLLLLLAAACQTPPGPVGAEPRPESIAQEGADAAPKDASIAKLRKRATAADKAYAKARRAARLKTAERELAELTAADKVRESEEGVRAARVALEMARSDRVRFDAMERPVMIGEARLSVGQAEERLRVAETDLLGILEIFEEESEARAKDEIIRRNEIAVATAKARVGQAQLKQAMVVEGELPARMAKLSEAVRGSEAKVAAAEAKAEHVKRRATLDVGVAKNEESEARSAASKAEKERAQARKRLKAAKEKAGSGELIEDPLAASRETHEAIKQLGSEAQTEGPAVAPASDDQ